MKVTNVQIPIYLSYIYSTVNFYCVQIHSIAFISVSNRHLVPYNESEQCINSYYSHKMCSI